MKTELNPAFVPLNSKPFVWSDTLKPVVLGELGTGRHYEFKKYRGVMVISAKNRKVQK